MQLLRNSIHFFSEDPILHHITHDLDLCFSIHTLSTLRTLWGWDLKKNSLLVLRMEEHSPEFGKLTEDINTTENPTWIFVDVFPCFWPKNNRGRVHFQPLSPKKYRSFRGVKVKQQWNNNKNMKLYSQRRASRKLWQKKQVPKRKSHLLTINFQGLLLLVSRRVTLGTPPPHPEPRVFF